MKLEVNGRVWLGRKEVLEKKEEAAEVVVALAKTLAAAMAERWSALDQSVVSLRV